MLELANGKRFVYDIVNIRNPTLAHDSPKGEALEALKAQTSARSRTTDDIIAQTGAGAQGGAKFAVGGIFTGTAADYANRSRQGGVDDGPGGYMVITVAGVYDILFGMRGCRISLPNRCYHLISRVAHRGIGRGAPL